MIAKVDEGAERLEMVVDHRVMSPEVLWDVFAGSTRTSVAGVDRIVGCLSPETIRERQVKEKSANRVKDRAVSLLHSTVLSMGGRRDLMVFDALV